jgi:two-component system, chemotaxis family, sensor kinase CheA
MPSSIEITPELLAGFLDEAPEYLDMLDAGLMEFETHAGSGKLALDTPELQEQMNTMFRAAHSLKGLAAAFGFGKIKELTHRMETLFDQVRMGKRALSADSFETLFSVFDRLKALVSELSDGAEGEVEIADVLTALDAILDAPAGVDSTEKPAVEAECAGGAVVATSDTVGDAVGVVGASETSFVSADAESLAQGEVFSDPELAAIFVETTVESLDELSHGLLQLEESPADAELLNTIFRCAHNIKGASGAAGLTGFNHLTHNMETIFDLLRNGELTLDEGLTTAVFKVVDDLRATIDGIKRGEIADVASEAVGGRFENWIDGESAVVRDESDKTDPESSGECATQPATADGADTPGPDFADGELAITVDFPAGCDENAIQAFLICNKLGEFGELKSTTPDIDDMTGDAVLDTVQFILVSESDPADLERILSAYGVDRVRVSDGGGVTEVANAAVSETTVPNEAVTSSLAETVPAAPAPTQTPVAVAVENVPATPKAASSQRPAASSPTAAPKAAVSPAPATSVGKPKAAAKKPDSAPVKTGETLRVDQERLDQLMNLGGELVINRARFAQIHGQFRSVFDGRNLGYLVEDMTERVSQVVETVSGLREADAENRSLEEMSSNLAHLTASFQQVRSLVGRVHDLRTSMFDFDEALHGLSRVSDGIQKGIMGTRMVAVGPLFTRFKRVVRDIAKSSGKKIDLVLKGEATELDKRMIDELGDPLTHMVRNSVDHGLELPEVRLAAGKPEVGTVTLEALHRGNSICIVVSDDGAGVNLERVRAKVLERELATQSQVDKMSDKELTQFIMKPGFSTAPQVTDLSGRGMGMDIVLSKIDKLNGSVDVDSTPGVGSQVTINLPLTLAILTSLVARVGRNVYAIPLETVAEIITVQRSDVQCIQRREVVRVRDRVIPIAVFEELFGTKLDGLQTTSRGGDDLTLVIVGFENKKIGLIVDELLGQEDVVIKSISENYRNVYGIAGASIRGDGSVSLILDVNAMMDMAAKPETPQRVKTTSQASEECVPA